MPAPTVWRSEYRINVSVFGNTQFPVAIEGLANGRYALGWTSNDTDSTDDDARFSLRGANGDAPSPSFDDEVLQNAATVDEGRVAVASLADGRFVYVWQEAAASGEIDTYAEVRNLDGSIFKSRFVVTIVNGAATHDQFLPSVAGLSSGNFMVVHRDDPATTVLRAQVFDIAGNLISGPATVNATGISTSNSNVSEMALLANGNVVITWTGGVDGASEQQKFAILSPTGTIVKVETDVNPEDATIEDDGGTVVALANGNFVVIFERQADANDIQGRLFDAAGNALGARFDISTGGMNDGVRAVALPDDRFMVVYDNGIDLFGQMMFADGTKDGTQFTISSAVSAQTDADVALLADGRVVVSWVDLRTGDFDIWSAIYDPRTAGLATGASTFADDWVGTGFGDFIYGLGGNDILDGAGGNDYLYGEAGEDNLQGGAGNDRIVGGSGNDTINGGVDSDAWLGGGLGDDTINGSDGDDRIDGGANADTMSGGFGNDTMTGGTGNDTMLGGSDNDLLFGEAGDDFVNGLLGNDDVRGGDGNDTVHGGDDSDAYLGGDNGDDLVAGGTGNDRVDGGAGNDQLFGNEDIDFISGGTGNDIIDGGAGNDILHGNAGNDTLRPDLGRDTLYGHGGNDTFRYWAVDFADALADTIYDFAEVAGSDLDTLLLQGVAGNYQFLDGAGFVRVYHTATGGSVYVNNMSAATIVDQVVYF